MRNGFGIRLPGIVGIALVGLVALALGAWDAQAQVQAQARTPDPEQRVIIGLRAEAQGVFTQGLVRALEVRIESGGGRVEERLELIDAVVATLDAELREELEGDPRVRYVVPDGVVGTPEFWARLAPAPGPEQGSGEPSLAPRSVTGSAIPVELYSWGVERIRAPEVHRTRLAAVPGASDTGSGRALALGALGVLWALGALGLRMSPLRRRSRLVVGGLLVGTLAALSGCTAAWVLPHPGVLGEGVTVALLDTGVDLAHPDLRSNVLGGIDFVNGDNDPSDDNGHGTGVAGLLAAAENGLGLVGTAPRVKIWSVKILSYDERGSISDLIRGLEWALRQGVQIIGMSLGTEEDNAALRDAIRAVHQAGVLLVAAAGNKGYRVLYPAAYPEVIAVASTDENDQRAWFSNMGPEVDLVAPGTNLLTTARDGEYQRVSGTSFSVPQVAGVAALVMAAGLRDAGAVRRRLEETAQDLGLFVQAQGRGLVDAARAVLGP